MKTLLTLLTAISVLSIAVPVQARDHHQRRIVNYVNGMPVYANYQIVGYNRMGMPIYQWVTQPVVPVRGGPPGHFKGWHHDNGNHNGWYHHH